MAPFRKPDRYSQNNRKGQTSVRDADTKAIRGGKGNRKPPQDVQLPHPNEDRALSKDISKFIKGLNLSEANPDVGGSQKLKKVLPPKLGSEPAIKVPIARNLSVNRQNTFIAQPNPQWYESIPHIPPHAPAEQVDPAKLASLTSRASSLLESDTRTFQASSTSNSSASEASFLHNILQSGTLSDRLSALTLLVQSSPVHNVRALETLKTMAERGKGKGGREECLKALRCVVDWWVGGGAPPRKLKYFRDQPLHHHSVTDQHFLLWYFEDWLKKYFFSILQILENLSLDPLPYVRTQALSFIFTLLRDKPEQEQNLLRLLVNKLGDNEKSMCSRASYYLLQLLQAHPSMKVVVVQEVIGLVLRPHTASTSSTKMPVRTLHRPKRKTKGINEKRSNRSSGTSHARYYATITFNQIVLTPRDRDVALQLIHVYFEMFKELLGEGKEIPDEEEDPSNEKEVRMDKVGRVMDNRKGKGKRKLKESKGAAGFAEVEDAHSKLVSAILTGVNRALPFAKIDSDDTRLSKHIDTLFLITHTSTFNISLQALVLLQHIASTLSSSSSSSATSRSIIDRYYRTLYSSMHDSRLATSSKQAMYLNLLFKSVKADPDKGGERVKALLRRFVQVLVSGGGGETEFVAGGLFLLGELFSTVPGLRTILNADNTFDTIGLEEGKYDPLKRDPKHANASSSPLWELTPLLRHYHPAIALHASQLLSGKPLTASADLSLNTLSHFLDRFVYKNPKQVGEVGNDGKSKGGSVMQPAASALDGTGVKLMKGENGSKMVVNDDAFLRRKAEDVPVDLIFFHNFFSRKKERSKAKSAKVGKRKNIVGESEEDGSEEGSEESDDESEEEGEDQDEEANDSDSENEAEIWKAMKASMPSVKDGSNMTSDESSLESDDEGHFLHSESESGEDGQVDDFDNESLISMDQDAPEGLIEYDSDDDDDRRNKKRKREASEGRGGVGKKKLRTLPTFASYDEYAKMIEDGTDEDL